MLFLLFDDLQDFHGACFYADAAGNTLGSGIFGLENHDLHGANLYTLTAADAVLLADHVDAGLGVLGNGIMLADLHALTALDANIGLCTAVFAGNDLDAAQIRIKLLIKRLGTGTDTFQASHALRIFVNHELLHNRELSFVCIYLPHYTATK